MQESLSIMYLNLREDGIGKLEKLLDKNLIGQNSNSPRIINSLVNPGIHCVYFCVEKKKKMFSALIFTYSYFAVISTSWITKKCLSVCMNLFEWTRQTPKQPADVDDLFCWNSYSWPMNSTLQHSSRMNFTLDHVLPFSPRKRLISNLLDSIEMLPHDLREVTIVQDVTSQCFLRKFSRRGVYNTFISL